MKKLTLIFMLLLSVSIHTGCGSSSESEDGETASADAAEGGGDEEGLDGEEGGDVAADEGGDASESGEGEIEGGDEVVADLGEGETDEAALPEEGTETADAGAPAEAAPAPEGGTDSATAEAAPEPAPEPVAVAEEPPPAPVMAPYLKVKDTPYKSNGRLMNTVYLSRPGDTLEGVAEKTGVAKKDLVADNPILKRGVKPGDKIYFQSSRRPDDAAQMVTYFEDKGIPPQVYVTKDGDNIRAFSQDLLGHPNAWKEVWATNSNVESKDVVPPGIELKYWPSDSGGSVATNTLPQEPPVASNPTEMPPPPPPQDMAMNNPPPPPPMDSMPPPPPPPPMDDPGVAPGIVDSAPPPPPPPTMKNPGGGMNALDNDTTMALGVAAILLVAAAALFAVIMKRSRSKKIKLSQTQV
ncbi:MAG: LysM domain-containing protein [Bdellovibrionia bacterium]